MPWIDKAGAGSAEDLFPEWFIQHWSFLALSSHQADPFCCAPAWNLAYHVIINPGRRIFYAASENGAVIFSETRTVDGQPVLTPLEDSWLYGQPLLGEEALDLFSAVLPEIQDEYAEQPLFLISGIMDPSPFSARLYLRHTPGYAFYRHALMSQCSASLLGGREGWLSRRSANCRSKLKKAIRKAGLAGISFERVRPDPSEAEKIYRRILAAEEKSWKGIGECGMTESPSREFYKEMLRLLAKSRSGLVIFATRDGEDEGFIFGGLLGRCYRGQQFSYSQSCRDLSLGNILQYEKIGWLAELGCVRYDMGPATGPRMEYKKHWTEQSQDFQTWLMRRV